MPTFIHDGHSIYQSLAIIEYLDDIQPEPRLIPQDVKERAYARSLALMTIADAHPLTVPRIRKHLARTFGADDKAIADWGRHWSHEGLATYERVLTLRPPAPFALGAEPGIADICIAGHVVGGQYLKIEMDAYPMVAALSATLLCAAGVRDLASVRAARLQDGPQRLALTAPSAYRASRSRAPARHCRRRSGPAWPRPCPCTPAMCPIGLYSAMSNG